MSSIMTSRQAAELDHALERNGWTAEDVKKLSEGERLRLVLDYLHGRARIVYENQENKVIVTRPKIYLRCVSGGEALEIDKTKGKKTLARSGKIFKAGVDLDFENWGLDKSGKPFGKMPVRIYEIVASGMFMQIFGWIFGTCLEDGANAEERKHFIEEYRENLRKICMKNDEQIINFVQKFPDKLCKKYATFFLREDEDTGNFFVVDVYVHSDGGLSVDVARFEDDSVWSAGHRHRIVVPPQLTKTL